ACVQMPSAEGYDMSEYLGWRERKAPAYERSKYNEESSYLPVGPIGKSYESYVKNIFHPSNRLKKDPHQKALDNGISASRMLEVERTYGKHALSDTWDDDTLLKTPLESLYNELGMKGPEVNHYRQYPVYEPKQSSEYLAVMNNNCRDAPPPAYTSSYASYREKTEEDWRKNNRQMLVDYKDFNSSPLSPYLYQSHPYVRNQDSRIVGSNFVQVTSRPKDRFLEKVDDTLKMVREMPRYT
ncbi:hypothetical protein PMAYCL1PPCAC_12754, partial [Pristionchus mayeri]